MSTTTASTTTAASTDNEKLCAAVAHVFDVLGVEDDGLPYVKLMLELEEFTATSSNFSIDGTVMLPLKNAGAVPNIKPELRPELRRTVLFVKDDKGDMQLLAAWNMTEQNGKSNGFPMGFFALKNMAAKRKPAFASLADITDAAMATSMAVGAFMNVHARWGLAQPEWVTSVATIQRAIHTASALDGEVNGMTSADAMNRIGADLDRHMTLVSTEVTEAAEATGGTGATEAAEVVEAKKAADGGEGDSSVPDAV